MKKEEGQIGAVANSNNLRYDRGHFFQPVNPLNGLRVGSFHALNMDNSR
jgi:hypothetical protein